MKYSKENKLKLIENTFKTLFTPRISKNSQSLTVFKFCFFIKKRKISVFIINKKIKTHINLQFKD